MKKVLMVFAMVLVFGIGLSHANDFGSLQAFPVNPAEQQGAPVTAGAFKIKPLTATTYYPSGSDPANGVFTLSSWFYVGDSVGVVGNFNVVGSGTVTVKFQFYDALGIYQGQSKGTFAVSDGGWYVYASPALTSAGIWTVKVSWIWAAGTMVKSMTTKVDIAAP